MKKLVVFVCQGNIHRSAVAEVCLREVIKRRGLDDQFEVISRGLQGSAGTQPPKHRKLSDYPLEWSIQKPILEKLGIDISGHTSKRITYEIVERASLIFAMDHKVLADAPNSLIKQFPEYSYKMKIFGEFKDKRVDIPDCGGSADIELHRYVDEMIVQIIKEKIEIIIDFLRNQ